MRLQLQDTLRDVALKSAAHLLALVEAPAAPRAVVRAPADVDLDGGGGDDCGGDSGDSGCDAGQRRPRAGPLLSVELLVAAGGAAFEYATPPDALAARVLALLERGLERLQGLPDVEPQVMANLTWPDPAKLAAPRADDPAVAALRAALARALAAALRPAGDYLAAFRAHEPLLGLDADAAAARFACSGASGGAQPLPDLDALRTEAAHAEAALRDLAERLPATACLGLVQVHCGRARDALLRRQQQLVAALRARAAAAPRALLAGAGAGFAELERALRAKARCLEDVEAQRRLIAELPARTAALVADIEAAKVGGPCVSCFPGA